MSKKECPSCAMEIDAKSNSCPVCNYEFTDRRGASLRWIAALLAILFLLYILLF